MARYASQRVTWGRAFLATLLAALGARPAAALLVAPKIRLSKNPAFAVTPDSVIADFTTLEANFSGYTAGGYVPTLVGPVNLSAFILGQTTNVLPVAAVAGPFVDNQVYGYWCDDGTNVVLAEAFGDAGPIGFNGPGDYLDLQVSLPLAMLQSAG